MEVKEKWGVGPPYIPNNQASASQNLDILLGGIRLC